MDGIQASAKILEFNTGIPIVALTANIMSNDMEIYRASGMHDCVGKPFTSQELWRCLVKYLKPVRWQSEDEIQRSQLESELQNKLINNFVKDNRNRFNEIAEAINAGDITLAHRLAHTLKGNAGQLGKKLLQKAAMNVEHNLKSGENLVTRQEMVNLETELSAVLAEFDKFLVELHNHEADIQVESGFAEIDFDEAKSLLETLEAMIEMGDPECRRLIPDLRRIPDSELLISQMDDLDFELALVTLDNLKKVLGM